MLQRAACSATAFSPSATGVPTALQTFVPTHAAALARLQVLQPSTYARTRNALDGDVTGLSPYFTHGLLGIAEAVRHINTRHPLGFDDKLVFEFAWREFFHHVWSRAPAGGDGILGDMHGELPWQGRYADTLPADIREGRTGVPVIDTAVRVLYATGYLHNHARMWLASYVVHCRKVHWRAGADWLYAHLLDGDLPSNHLSWQWVASTFSSKPYLFNAENVAKYAPARARAAWDASGTVVDQAYEALGMLATSKPGCGAERGPHEGVSEPTLHTSVPTGSDSAFFDSFKPLGHVLTAFTATTLIAKLAPGQTLELVHPWALASRRADSTTLRLGVIHLPAHAAWPWSARRWAFVLQAMAGVVDAIWVGDLLTLHRDLNIAVGQRVTAQAVLFPHYREALTHIATATPAPRLLANPAMLCRSFSKFYDKARRDAGTLAHLL